MYFPPDEHFRMPNSPEVAFLYFHDIFLPLIYLLGKLYNLYSNHTNKCLFFITNPTVTIKDVGVYTQMVSKITSK